MAQIGRNEPWNVPLRLPALMADFEREQLRRYTPCLFSSREDMVRALAEVHVELMLIHPFREGNGRLGRLLAFAGRIAPPRFQRDGW